MVFSVFDGLIKTGLGRFLGYVSAQSRDEAWHKACELWGWSDDYRLVDSGIYSREQWNARKDAA